MRVPPGQAKLVTCVRGSVRDVVVDLRLGSPEFGTYETTALDAESGRAVYVPEGVVHGFLALTDDACVSYLLSTPHVPGTQIDIDPLDPDLAIAWTAGAPADLELLLSAKDRAAPGVREAEAAGLLPYWRARGTRRPCPSGRGFPGDRPTGRPAPAAAAPAARARGRAGPSWSPGPPASSARTSPRGCWPGEPG